VFGQASSTDPNGRPTTESPIPEELQTEFTDAYWRSLRWQTTTWLGQRVNRAPSDLFAYQELLSRVRPDFVIETGGGNGGRALFLASICELLGTGQVISIDTKEGIDRPQHPRITYVTGKATDAATVEQVRELVGDGGAFVILGTHGRRDQMLDEFEAYHGLVSAGSYVVMENTILNGHPVWPSFGPGPAEAVRGALMRHTDFAPDPDIEKYVPTFNRAGFLRRNG
jgi:cephalosporin hydroxylase